MSLKAFHFVFIVVSALLSAGIGVWEFRNFAASGRFLDALFGALALLVGAGLVIYGIAFLRKLKHVGFL